MSNDYFQISLDAGVAHLQLNRPERLNAMGPAFFSGLRDAVRALDADGATRALVISSTGKHFSAGMALDVFASMGDAFDTRTPRARMGFEYALRDLMDCLDTLDQVRFPVICAVQGGCIGGGLDLAVACDIRVCTADAFFALQETEIGMTADLGVLQRLPKIIPAGVARQMAYTSERLDAQRALGVGLVNAVLADSAALLDHALELARTIAAKSPLAVAGCKSALNFARDHGTAESLRHMALLQSALFDTQELAEAVTAWRGKRPGRFAPLVPLQTFQAAPASGLEPLQASSGSTGSQSFSPPDQRTTRLSMSFSINSTVQELLDNDATKAILEQNLPGLADHPQLGMAKGFALSMVAKFSGGLISEDALQKIDTELKALG